ncbi:uncharacterized protein ACMZJ9_005210 [Mantella aurantiaca]
MNPAELRWSESEYTLQGYVAAFHSSFPNVIQITEGFLGKQEIDSVSSSTVVRVHSLYNQKRVTAETKTGKLFSLPVKLKRLKFLVPQTRGLTTTLKNKQVMTLADILAKYPLPVTVHTSTVLSYKQKGDMKSDYEMFSELTLQDTYVETFLFGHPIDKGRLFVEEPIVIPMYMTELKLVVAVGFQNGNAERWNHLCGLLTHQVKNFGKAANVTFEEILMLDKKDVNPQEPSYSTIEPIYIDISEINNDFKKPLDNKGNCNVYQYTIIPELKQLQQTQNPLKTEPQPVQSHYDLIPELKQLQKAQNPLKTESPPVQSQFNLIPELKQWQQTQNSLKTEPPPVQSQSFKSLHDIPRDLHNLTVQQVCECLALLNMDQYTKAFEASQVDGQLVYDLNPEMMESCLGMNRLNGVKFLKFRDGWRPNLQG